MFDPNQYDPATGVGNQLPEGDHPVVITGSEIKPTKAGDGSYLQLNLKIVEGPFVDKEGAERLNLMNQNQTAVQIAMSQLTAICWCTGYMQSFDPMQDCSVLYNKVFRIVVVKQSGANGDKGYTEIQSYKSYDGDTPARGKQAPQIRTYQGGVMGGGGPVGGGNPLQGQPPMQQPQGQMPPQMGNPQVNQGMPMPNQPVGGQMPPQQPVGGQMPPQQPQQGYPPQQQPNQGMPPQGQQQGQQQGIQPNAPQGQPQMPQGGQQPGGQQLPWIPGQGQQPQQ